MKSSFTIRCKIPSFLLARPASFWIYGTLLSFGLLAGCKKTPHDDNIQALTRSQQTTFSSSLNSLGRMEKVANLLNENGKTGVVVESLSTSDTGDDASVENAREQQIASALQKADCRVKLQSSADLTSIEIDKTDSCGASTTMLHQRVRKDDPKSDKSPSSDGESILETIKVDLSIADSSIATSNDLSEVHFNGSAQSYYLNGLEVVTYTKSGEFNGTAESKTYGHLALNLTYSGTETFGGSNTGGTIQSILTIRYPQFVVRLQRNETATIVNNQAVQAREYFLNGVSITQNEFADDTGRLGLIVGDFAEQPVTKK